MDPEKLRKEVERMWDSPANRETVEYLWKRFVDEEGMSEDNKAEFFHYYKENMDMFNDLAALGGGSPPHSAASEEPSHTSNKRKRGRYKKCFWRSLEIVCFVGKFRMSHRGCRIPWQRLSPEWNRMHPEHPRSPDEMKMVYIRNRRECYVSVLKNVVAVFEGDTNPPPVLDTYLDALQNPDAYRIDISGSKDTGYGINIYPAEMHSVTLEELRERYGEELTGHFADEVCGRYSEELRELYGEELAAPFAEHLRQKKSARKG